MSAQRWDAIVVGAGPSGATAARILARSGLRTLLIEKGKLPRYKTCGGGITHKAAKALPFSIEPVVERTLNKMDFSWRMGNSYVVGGNEPLVYMVQRSRFDNYLTEQAVAAGAVLMDETTVLSAEQKEDGGAVVNTAKGIFEADYLVGADGATGRVARGLGLMSDRWALAAIESELVASDETMAYWRDKLGLDLGVLPASYGWVFPKGDHLSVGVGGLPLVEDYGSKLKEYDALHTKRRSPGVTRVLRSHGYLLPCRRPGSPVQRGRAMLVGDAAGLVEAFTGEGIFWAIRSGQLAARSIVKDGGEPRYQERLDRALMPDLLAARRWMGVYVGFPLACYALPRYVRPFWSAVCRIVRGERRYVHVRRMLGPAGLAERFLRDPLLSLK